MKRCPECRRDYYDDTLLYCLDDGNALLEGPASGHGASEEPATAILSGAAASGFAASESRTRAQINTVDRTAVLPSDSVPRPVSSAEYIIGGIKQHRVAAVIAACVLVVAVVAIGVALFRYSSEGERSSAQLQAPKLQRLTTSGVASDAAISPDGKYVAHVKSDGGQLSLWLRQVATTSDTQIVPPSTGGYNGITFSKDGDYIYYVLAGTLYQVPILGGTSKKVIEKASSPVSFSLDATRLAFIRADQLRGETALVVANADGTGERQVAVRKQLSVAGSYCNGGPSWSPDGKKIAVGVLGYSESDPEIDVALVEVQVEDGAEKPITTYRWNPHPSVQVVWLADGKSLAVTGIGQESSSFQIWHVSYPGGEVSKITNDLNSYNRLSITADSNALVTVQTETAAGIWIAPETDMSRTRQISSGRYDGTGGLSWTPGGKIVYTANDSGSTDLWVMDKDGKDKRQLTANARSNVSPMATSDGRYIVFSSNRTSGARRIWRIDPDGGNPKQLTPGPDNFSATSSPDGRWVFFNSSNSGSNRAWKVSIDGGEPIQFTDRFISSAIISPDSTLIACFYRTEEVNAKVKVAIIPIAGGEPISVFDSPQGINQNAGLRWMPDGRSLTFIATISGVSNVWSLPLAGGKPLQVTDFKTDTIFSFDYSPDGKQYALSRGTRTNDVVLISGFRK